MYGNAARHRLASRWSCSGSALHHASASRWAFGAVAIQAILPATIWAGVMNDGAGRRRRIGMQLRRQRGHGRWGDG